MILFSMLGSGRPIVLALSSTLSVVRVCAATGEHSVWPNTIVKGAPSFSSNSRHQRGRHRGAARADRLDRREIGRREGRMFQHRDQHGGNAEHRIAAIGPEHFQHQSGLERLDQHLWSRPSTPRRSRSRRSRRCETAASVVTKTSPGSTPIRSAVSAPLLSEAAMTKQGALWKARGARGVLDHDGIVGTDGRQLDALRRRRRR